MRATQALPIGHVIRGAAVPELLDVIGVHSVPWLRLGAALAVLDSLAATACSSDHMVAPFSILRPEVERISGLVLRLYRTGIELPDARSQCLEFKACTYKLSA
jgi:hypothetical protein